MLKRRKINKVRYQFSSAQVLIVGFIAIILVGTLLLSLPISSKSGSFTGFETSFFTSVSATCVTGLVIKDTVTYWSGFGQVVILSLIQIGGLGFMMMAVMMSFVLRRKITPREQVIVAQSLNINSNENIVGMVKRVIIAAFSIEFIGAALLSTQFIPIFGVCNGIYRSIFHSVSAFCNAGFDILGDYSGEFGNMVYFAGNSMVTITLMLLIIIGGIGFIVWDDIYNLILRRRRMSVYSKIILIATASLIVFGTVSILIFERNNPLTIRDLPFDKKLLVSMFQSVTTRTAGFCTVDNTILTDGSKMVSLFLMLIGGASGSTAGGVKVGSFVIVLYTIVQVMRGRTDIVIFKRKIAYRDIMRAVAILGLEIFGIIAGTFLLTVSDGTPLIPTLYETTSAFSTVGLSLSLTPSLSFFGHMVLAVIMFFGRVGLLTLTYSIMENTARKNSCITYPEANILIG